MKRTPLLILLFLLLLIAVGPLFFPYSKFLPDLEAKLGARLKAKVSVADASFSYSPSPVFVLHNVVVDSPDVAKIGSIEIPFSMRNLLGTGKVLQEVRLKDVSLSRQFAVSLPERLDGKAEGIRVNKLVLEGLSVKFEQGEIGPVNGELSFTSSGKVENLDVSSSDDKIRVQIQPAEPGNFQVQFSAKAWKLPFGWPMDFDYLNLTGKANSDSLQVTDINGGLYNGNVTGTAQLLWGPNWKLSGKLQAKNIRVEPLTLVFSSATRSTGIMNGEGTFAYESDHYTKLFDNPSLQGHFALQDGELRGFDLIAPLKSPSTQVRRGGTTSFNELQGNLVLQGKAFALRGVKLSIGKFHAEGEMAVREGKISGGAAVALNSGAVAASDRVALGGTLAAPELRSGGVWRPRAAGEAASLTDSEYVPLP